MEMECDELLKLKNDVEKIDELSKDLENKVSLETSMKTKLEEKISQNKDKIMKMKNLRIQKIRKHNKLCRKMREKRREEIISVNTDILKYMDRCNNDIYNAHIFHYEKLINDYLRDCEFAYDKSYDRLVPTRGICNNFTVLTKILNKHDKPVTLQDIENETGLYAYVIKTDKLVEIVKYPNKYGFTIDTKNIEYLIERMEF